MIVLDPLWATLIAVILFGWLIAAIWMTLRARRAIAADASTRTQIAQFSSLLDTAPAIPMLVGPDGRIEANERLARWLGLPRLPERLDGLAGDQGGFSAEDLALLTRKITTTQRSGRGFAYSFHVAGSNRVLHIRAEPAPRLLGGGIILWLFDATEARSEIERLSGEADRATRALGALSSLIEAAPFPMWHRGPDLKLALVNTAYVRAVEARDAAEVIERGLELVDAVDGIGPLAAAAAARDVGERSLRHAPATIAGERRMIRIVDVPLGAAGVAGYAVDIEEVEEARADLGRFARAQRDLLDRLSAGVAQFAADRSLVFFNQNFLRLFALKPEWLIDGPEFDRVLERMREAQRLPEARDFPGWKAERRAWFNATDYENIEENWLLPGGAHIRVVAQPLPDGGLVMIFEDRTEQLQLASARDTLLRVRTATFDNLFEAIAVFAADGRLHSWNSRFRALWDLEEADLEQRLHVDALVEVVARKLVNPSRASLIRDLVRVATIERQQRSGRVALADGRHYEFAAVPLPDGNALFTLLDITASRQIEQALRERTEALEDADKLKSAFVANMSYELRVPLTSIQGFAELLAGGHAGALEPTAKDYVGAILTSVGRLTTLIEDVLDLTQSEAGNLPMAEENVDIAALVREAATAARDSARDRKLDLVLDFRVDLGAVRGDKRRLRQALDHLLRNAISYTPPEGRVLFHAGRVGDEIEIVVSDNGVGIDPKERDRVFDRFHRARSAPRDANAGLGLGLPLTRQFVEAHGGLLKLLTEPGQGTTVVIRLPRVADAASESEARAEA